MYFMMDMFPDWEMGMEDVEDYVLATFTRKEPVYSKDKE